MAFFNFSLRKTLSSIFILFFLFSVIFVTTPAKKVHAQWVVTDPGNTIQGTISAVSDTVTHLKEFGLDKIAWAISKRILENLTADTVNWINNGFTSPNGHDGNPAFITDPAQFFTQVSDQVVIDALGQDGPLLNKICTPFRPQIRLALMASYFQQNRLGQCSISSVIRNYDAFTQDFSQGGWEGWFSMTQNMQNNPYGSYLEAQDELSIGIKNQSDIYHDQADWGKGFLSFEKCKKGTTIGEKYGINTAEKNDPANKKCAQSDKETVTPGSIIENQLNTTLSTGVKKLEVADELNEIFGALLNKAFKAVTSEVSGGLRGINKKPDDGSSPSLYDQLQADSKIVEPSLGGYNQNSDVPAPYVPIPVDEIKAEVASTTAAFQDQYQQSCTTDNGSQGLLINNVCIESPVSVGGGSGSGTTGSGGSTPPPANQISIVAEPTSATIAYPIPSWPGNQVAYNLKLNCPASVSPDSTVNYNVTSNTLPAGTMTTEFYVYGVGAPPYGPYNGGSLACTGSAGKAPMNNLYIRLGSTIPKGTYSITLGGNSNEGNPVGSVILKLTVQ